MAISKILHMKDCGGHFHGKHLKSSLDYVMNPEKTQGGRLVGAVNCQADTAFEQMKATKRKFGKVDKRQGYHLILSFKEDEVDPDTAFALTQRFVAEYLGKEYEAVFVVHDNTDHVHSHIIFNSVSFVDGKKYRYEKGDWAKKIQPITNRLCEEYGLSVIDIEEEQKERERRHGKGGNKQQGGSFPWKDLVRRDLDACILQADTFENFGELLREKGYEVRSGKSFQIRPPGEERFFGCKAFGKEYSEEAVRGRILQEDISYYQSQQEEKQPVLVRGTVKHYRRAKLSGLQKQYYAKLYRTGKLKKRPYSQVWKYKSEIQKFQQLQEQYLFLARHQVRSVEELAAAVSSLTEKRKEASADKGRVYKAKARFQGLFDTAAKMELLEPAEASYQNGDAFFEKEHMQWARLEQELSKEGYSLQEVQALIKQQRERYAKVCARERAAFRELNLGKSIWGELASEKGADGKVKEQSWETSRDRKGQPVR